MSLSGYLALVAIEFPDRNPALTEINTQPQLKHGAKYTDLRYSFFTIQ